MPRKKNWRRSESRRVVLGQQEVLEGVSHRQNPASVQVLSPASVQALSPVSMQAHTPASVQIQSPASEQALSPASVQEIRVNHKKILKKEINKINLQTMYHKNSMKMCIDLVLRQLTQSWNAFQILFGRYHQNDVRFSEQSRGFQCTGNALCMLLYSACLDINNSSTRDKILCDGDSLYQKIIHSLKADGKFIHAVLSLDEIPDEFEVELGKFIVEKQPIVSGFLVDTHENHGLPTLHRALHSAFTRASSGLITIGAICSAVFKKNDLYVFLDSLAHGKTWTFFI